MYRLQNWNQDDKFVSFFPFVLQLTDQKREVTLEESNAVLGLEEISPQARSYTLLC